MKTLTPRTKLLAASGLLLALAAAASLNGISAASLARVLLGLAAIGGAVLFAVRRPRPAPGFALEPRLRVVQRAGLSPRCSVALVALDGAEFLVAYGDGFAEIRPASAARVRGRRPVPAARTTRRPRGGVR